MKRRLLHICLLFAVMNAATELHQLFKLPALVAHYRHHLLQNPSLGFLEFLSIHYSPHHPKDNDNQEDRQLPFRAVGTITHIDLNWTPATAEPLPPLFSPDPICRTETGDKPIRRAYGIFHPPRQA